MLLEALLATGILLFLVYNWIFGYWDRRKVFNVKWEFTFGILIPVFIRRKYVHNYFQDIYSKYKSKGLIGFYAFFNPILMVTDPDLIKTVLAKDFTKFATSALKIEEKTDPLFSKHMFVAKDMEVWKELRGIQTSVQTTVKFKEMLPMIRKVAEILVNYLRENTTEPVVVKDVTFRYTVDVACSCAFGIEPSAITDKENNFIKYANSEKIFTSSPLALSSHFLMPSIANFFRLRILTKDAEEFFKALVEKTIRHRLETKTSKNDVINAIMNANEKHIKENRPEFTKVEMAAQCLTFYLDSTETSSNQLSFLLLDLANNPDIQEKLRKEISSVGKNPDEFDFEKIHSIDYLSNAINESLRLHTQVAWLSRTCTQDTILGNSPISKDTMVFIPAASIHKDPNYYPQPEIFDPERFSQERTHSLHKYNFLPFGEGPRICAGYKFALLQIKLAVIFLLLNFTILPPPDDNKKSLIEENSPLMMPGPETKLIFKPLIHNF